MPISFDESKRIFKLDTKTSSYIFQVFEQNYLVHLYYGAYIPDNGVEDLAMRCCNASFSPANAIIGEHGFSVDSWPMEYSCNGTGDMRISALAIKNHCGNASTDVRYVSHRIFKGKPALCGLPSLYTMSDDDATTLEIETIDKVTGAKVFLLYTVFENYGAMTRSVRVENSSDKPMDIQRVYSACVEFPTMDYNMMHLYGMWCKERTLTSHHLAHGIQSVHSKRGSSSHTHNPFVALAKDDATEDFGEAFGFNLVYSGNFAADIEVDFNSSTRLIMGINPTDFCWRLDPGESFTAPELVMVYSNAGVGEMSRIFHRLYSNHLIRGEWKNKKRPLLINSWEAAYFDFDDDKLVAFAERAKELGIEMLVMDDGWFGVRNDDRRSLGDWYVNENKLKGGLSSLIERVNALGLNFGIWYEPEMISPDSDLYRAHPDWCLQVPGREKSIGRNQYILDMSRKDVRDNIYEQMASVLRNNKIDYVKWDFNRNLTEVGSALLPPERQQEVYHRFVLGTYELMGRIVNEFPHILLENCSGGGGRFDPGMLYFSPQIWCSDNTDPIERLTIQFGTSMCYPVSTVGAHVSACSRTGYETKGNVAMSGTFGYELDPIKLTEEERRIVKKQVKDYHKYYDVIHFGDLYRLIAPTENSHRCAWGYVSQDKSEALFTFVTMLRCQNPTFYVRLKGLDPDKYYIDDETDEIHSGALLMNAGFNLKNRPCSDGTSYTIYLKEVKNK
ncbi:MAG: alpha-galactosidase [Clostridia bacterium]|nr:alpha-galactosidase [Clostridia bacterium]